MQKLSPMDQTKLVCSFLGGIILVTSITAPSFAANSIEIFTLNSEILPNEDVFVTGFVRTESFYKPLSLEVYDPNGELLYNPHLNFNEQGQFSWLIHPPLGKFDVPGTYTIIASHEDTQETSKIQFIVIGDETTKNLESIVKTDKEDSSIISKTILNSNEFADTKPKIQYEEISVKTTNSQTNQSEEIVEFLKSDNLVYLTPLSIAMLVGIVIIWMRATSGKQENKNNF